MLASPVANHKELSPASCRSPLLSEGRESAIGVHAPPPWEERHTPPSAPAAYTWLLVSAARPVMRPVTCPAPPEELE